MDRGDVLYFQKLQRETVYEALEKIKIEVDNARRAWLVYHPERLKQFTDEILKQLIIIEATKIKM